MAIAKRPGGGLVPRDLSQQAHRRLIGILGLLLPFLLYVVAGVRDTTGLTPWQLLNSVSDYYYTGAVAILTGILFALSLFLLTYQGYEGFVWDRVVGRVAGCAALGVALFPTGAPDTIPPLPWWRPPTGVIHYSSALVLFVSFIVFAMWLFRKSDVPRRQDRPPDKRWRNAVYLACGIAMIVAVLWAGISGFTKTEIFWPESIAIVAFAISWLVKGEADVPIRRAVARVVAGPPDDVRERGAA